MRKALFGFLICYCGVVSLSTATVFWKPNSVSFPDLPAKYAVEIGSSGTCGALDVADPLDACSPLRNVSASDKSNKSRFALIIRGQCTFEDKIRNAQNAGYVAAIVYEDREKTNLVYMMVNPQNVTVHAVFVGNEAGVFLKGNARGNDGGCCILKPLNGGIWTVLAISFLSVAVIVAFLVIAFFAPRRWMYWHGRVNQQPRTLNSRIVESLPQFMFSSDLLIDFPGGETCVICLEDYVDGELLKVLPCQHEYHSSCVDSWLTKWGTFCPVCKLDMRNQSAPPEVGELRPSVGFSVLLSYFNPFCSLYHENHVLMLVSDGHKLLLLYHVHHWT